MNLAYFGMDKKHKAPGAYSDNLERGGTVACRATVTARRAVIAGAAVRRAAALGGVRVQGKGSPQFPFGTRKF